MRVLITALFLFSIPFLTKAQTESWEFNTKAKFERNEQDFKFYEKSSTDCTCKIEVGAGTKTTIAIKVTENGKTTTYHVIDGLRTEDGYIYDAYITNPNASYGFIIDDKNISISSPDMMSEVRYLNK